MSSIERYVEPTVEPITVEQAKLHCRVTHAAEDSLFTDILIPTARQEAENLLQRTLCRTTWRLTLDGFPNGPEIRLPYPKIQAVSAIQYRDPAGLWQDLDARVYGSELADRKLYVRWDQMWPVVDYNNQQSVRIDYVAGYANPLAGTADEQAAAIQAAVPAAIKAWMLMRISTLYKFKDAIVLDRQVVQQVPTVDGLLDPYRVFGGLQ